MRHLDDLLYRQLVTGVPITEELRLHLASPCDDCARYLQERTVSDALDGRVDDALLPAKQSTRRPGELEAILARVPSPMRRQRERRPLAVAAVALAVVGLGVTQATKHRPLGDGVKGEAALTVSTTAAVVSADGHAHPEATGGRVSASDALSLRLDLSRDARISVVRLGQPAPEIVMQNEPTPAGQRDLRRDGQLVGLPMAGLSGEQRIAVVASERALSNEEIQAAARGASVPGAAVGGLSVQVSP